MKQFLGFSLKLAKMGYLRKFIYLVPKVPRQVNIEASNRCNLNCKMCKRRELKIPETDIDWNTYKNIIDKLPKGVKDISFGGYGEPFMHPKIYDMIKYAKKKGFFVTITTNGFLMISPSNRKKLCESGLDELRVSIEEVKESTNKAHPYSMKLQMALECLAKEKVRPKLIFNTIVHTGNCDQITDIIRFGEKIGIDSIELIHLDKKSNEINEYLSIEKEIELYKKIRKMKLKIPVSTLLDRYIGIRKYAFRKMKYCPFTYDVCHVTVDGDVTPCCFGLPRYKIDSILNNTLSRIWNGKGFKAFRKQQESVCRGCTLLKLQ